MVTLSSPTAKLQTGRGGAWDVPVHILTDDKMEGSGRQKAVKEIYGVQTLLSSDFFGASGCRLWSLGPLFSLPRSPSVL